MDHDNLIRRFKGFAVGRKPAIIGLYLIFVCGGVWSAVRGDDSLLGSLLPVAFLVLFIAAFHLAYKLSLRNIGAAAAVLVVLFIAEISGVNLGFPYGDFAYTNVLGPKWLDVPIIIPFFWFTVLISAWAAAERVLRYKHLVVAAIVVTAFDAVLEFAADSLDLWHWQGGRPEELNFISHFGIACLGIYILNKFASGKSTEPILPHLLVAQLLFFFISDVGIRFLSSQV